jgi:hypothetical protein
MMKMLTFAASLVAVQVAAAVSAQIIHQSPFVCDLSKLSSAERAHKADIGATLAARRIATRELADGYEFSFPGDTATLQMLNDWIATERLCCPFFDFDVRLTREDGPIALRLTGRKGTKEFLRADFGRWIGADR